MTTKQYKFFNLEIKEVKQIETPDGIQLGIIRGFLATYGNIDRVNDRIEPGAFTESLAALQQRNRPIRMLFQHQRTDVIGGFPIDKVQDMSKGLFVEGQINLDVQRGREVFALAKQGVLSDLSIGFSIIDSEVDKEGVRVLHQLELFEGSIVDEPANPEAVITEVKKFHLDDIKQINTKKDFEKLLRQGAFSQNAAKELISKFCAQRDVANEQKQTDSTKQRDVVKEEDLPNNKALLSALSEAIASVHNLKEPPHVRRITQER